MNPIVNVAAPKAIIKQTVAKPQINQINLRVQKVINEGLETYRTQLRAHMNYFDKNDTNTLFNPQMVDKTEDVKKLELELRSLLRPEKINLKGKTKKEKEQELASMRAAFVSKLEKLYIEKQINNNEYGYALAWYETATEIKTKLEDREEIRTAIQKVFPKVQDEFGAELDKIQALPYKNISFVADKLLELELKLDRCEQEILDQIITTALREGRVYMKDKNFKLYNELKDQFKSGKISESDYLAKRRRILVDALADGDVMMTKQEKTKYNKLMTKFNKVMREQKRYETAFHYMKCANYAKGLQSDCVDFIKPYSNFPFKIKVGDKRLPFYGNIYWINPKRNLMIIDNPDLTERLITDGSRRLISRRTADARGVYTTQVYNKDGDVVQISKYDHRTHKQKIIKKNK